MIIQVKIRGFRIELGEIEAALSQHPNVEQCVIVTQADESEDKRIVAYVVAAASETPKADGFRRFLKQSLPEYMIPAAFVQLESFPLTPQWQDQSPGSTEARQDEYLFHNHVCRPQIAAGGEVSPGLAASLETGPNRDD